MPTPPSITQLAGPVSSIPHLLESMAKYIPEAPAIMAPGRVPLTYGRLWGHINQVSTVLNSLGVGRNDRVAAVVPNGPEMAVAFLSVAASAICAPLNPDYRVNEFESHLSNLNARALLVQPGTNCPSIEAAQRCGINVIELTPDVNAEAGVFTLGGATIGRAAHGGLAQPDDIAVVLHTSGTTARPKKVPLTHVNICASAGNVVASLGLTSHDRCLNVMPLHHIHGLVGATLSTLMAGACILCTPGLDSTRFFAWIEEFHPTWYTATPTLHQAILSQADNHRDIIERRRLRFIRSCSASLPPQVMVELERAFHAPVVEAYGMTEAAHQICINPLPPRPRKKGSVGLATGPAVAIMDEAGNILSSGTAGEIVIRGPNVTSGYEGDPGANAQAFCEGWFRTGDQGYLDPDGYLFITGRLKELINRGGVKIAPREVEEALLQHPAVAQAAAFPLPHPTLGEDVAVALVLRAGARASEEDLRQFALARLADFKVPRRVLIVSDIPKGATGKLNRSKLAEQWGPVLKTEPTAPATPLEYNLVGIWEDLLHSPEVSVNDNFFDLGGDSLLAVRMFEEVRRITGKTLPLAVLFQAPTIKRMAQFLSDEATPSSWPSLVAIQPSAGGSRPPLFLVHALPGNVLYYRHLARHLGPDQPVYGLQAQGLDGTPVTYASLEDMAARYVKAIQTLQFGGPFFLGGSSFGGLVAFEMAQQLHARGENVAFLGLIDTQFRHNIGDSESMTSLASEIDFFFRGIEFHLRRLARLNYKRWWNYLWTQIGPAKMLASRLSRTVRQLHPGAERSPVLPQPSSPSAASSLPFIFQQIEDLNSEADQQYVPRPYPGKVTLFLGKDVSVLERRDSRRPKGLMTGGVTIHKLPGDHFTIMEEPHVRVLARKVRRCLDEAIEATRRADSPHHSPGVPAAPPSNPNLG